MNGRICHASAFLVREREVYSVYQMFLKCTNLLSQQFDFKKTILRKYRDECKDVCIEIFTAPYI